MAEEKSLQQRRELSWGPTKFDWGVARLDWRQVFAVGIRGAMSTCDCPVALRCDDCGGVQKFFMRLLGVMLVEHESEMYAFWAWLDRDESRLRSVFANDRVQLVWGLYNPGTNPRGWVAPCPHSHAELSQMFLATDRLAIVRDARQVSHLPPLGKLLVPEVLWQKFEAREIFELPLMDVLDSQAGRARITIVEVTHTSEGNLVFKLTIRHDRDDGSSREYRSAHLEVSAGGEWRFINALHGEAIHRLVYHPASA